MYASVILHPQHQQWILWKVGVYALLYTSDGDCWLVLLYMMMCFLLPIIAGRTLLSNKLLCTLGRCAGQLTPSQLMCGCVLFRQQAYKAVIVLTVAAVRFSGSKITNASGLSRVRLCDFQTARLQIHIHSHGWGCVIFRQETYKVAVV